MTPSPNAGRRGHTWQRVLRPTVLAAAHGRCYLCGLDRCPRCGKPACGGRTPPGVVHHLVDWAANVELRERRANLVAAHQHCNLDASRRDHPSNGSRW